MSNNIVKTKSDEKKWDTARKIVEDQYDISEGSPKYWPLVMGVFKNMKKKKKVCVSENLRKMTIDLL